jgi:hypothetical protein
MGYKIKKEKGKSMDKKKGGRVRQKHGPGSSFPSF